MNPGRQQILKLDSIYSLISNNSSLLKGYDAQIRSLDEASKGARSWDAPLLSTGLWMTPYDPSSLEKTKRRNDRNGSVHDFGTANVSEPEKTGCRRKIHAGHVVRGTGEKKCLS